MKKYLLIIFIWCLGVLYKGQKISMNFPEFTGKNYEFVIFQGSHQNIVEKGVIPTDGKFTLSIPEKYIPYIGMSRWLITNTKEGGGIDMYIPGDDFSVSCESNMPTNSNIIYKNNDGNKRLNDLHFEQDGILKRYFSMEVVTKLYSKEEKNYPVFSREKDTQKKLYVNFQKRLRTSGNYESAFLHIVNLTMNRGGGFYDKEEDLAKDISSDIVNNLNWDVLYTSGHWSTVIGTWLDIETNVFKNEKNFESNFTKIEKKLIGEKYFDFIDLVTLYLKRKSEDNYLKIVVSKVKESGKLSEGFLSDYIEKAFEKRQENK